MKRHIYYLLFVLSLANQAFAQNRIVTGIISDEQGALPGVTVIEKGLTSNHAITDVNGRFTLTLKGESNTLEVRFIGYKTAETVVGNRKSVNIKLEADTKTLEDVVVIGYGTQKKATLTGSVSVVSGDAIRRNPSASLQNALAGQLPGFFSQQTSGRPGADGADFYIRGVSSLGGVNTPLIIVDDIEFTSDQFARLDPNEIESLSILKDATMTAVYGIKGANGVVLITTRRGTTGKPKLSFKTESSLQQPTLFPKYLNSYESAVLHNQAAINDGSAPIFSDAALEGFRTGSNPYLYPDVNWKEVLFKDFSLMLRNNLDISGGSDKVKYFISLGYLYQNGMLKNFGKATEVNNSYYHSRYNYRSNMDIGVNKDLSLRLDLYGNIGQVNNPYYTHPNGSDKTPFYEYSSYLSLSPYAYPVYNPDGSYASLVLQPGRYSVRNIVQRLADGGYQRSNENNMNLNATATQKLGFLTRGLALKGTVSYATAYSYNRDVTRGVGPSFFWNPNNNTYTPDPANTYRETRYFVGYNAGNTRRILSLQTNLSYDRTFGKHHVYGLALYNRNSELRANTGFIPANFRGYTGRAGYDFKNKYLFQFVTAYNGTDQFGTGKKYGLFPAVSAGWNISEEPFFKNNVKFVDRLKVRGSYGLVGSDRLPNGSSYSYIQNYTGSGSASFGQTNNQINGIQEGRLANNDVTWEKQKELGLALEFDVLKNKISGVAEYFSNNRYDQLTTRGTVSQVFGQALPPVNLGEVENKGWDFELKYRDKISRDFSFNIRGQYSIARNKIVFMDEATAKFPWLARTGNGINSTLAYVWTGSFYNQQEITAAGPQAGIPVFNSSQKAGDLKYADLNGDGILNDFDKAYTSSPTNVPPVNFGFETGLNYKNFGVRVLFQGADDFIASAVSENIQFLGSNMLPIHQQAWTPELGDNAKYPRLGLTPGTNAPIGTPSTFWLAPGDYIRLKSAEINYNIPNGLIDRLHLQSARVFANGNNLFTWSKLTRLYNLDPEIASGQANLSYPPQRIFNFGLSVTF